MIADTTADSFLSSRFRRLVLPTLTATLLACRPGADFKVSVRVLDETTGRPISDAWVLVSARVDVEPEREPPYNRAIAGARDRTDSRGVAVLKSLEGLYWGEEPKDELWKMLAARKPKVEHRITLMKEGDLFVFAKDYGVLHHPLRFKGGGVSKEVPGLGLMGVKGEGTVLELDPADFSKGFKLTVKMAKPEDPEYLLGSFSPDSLWLFAGIATTGATGTTKKEKAAVYDFFVENLKPLLEQSTGTYQGHMRPESLFDRESREKFINHAPELVHNHDTTIHEWMTQKALELLPPGYVEVKQYAREIQAGVKAEDEGTRAINHFYNPYDPGNAFPLGESALKWGAIGYPDNPNNEWDWHDAQRYYREGDKAKAYKALGHVMHLLEDLSVPMHTHVVAHHSMFQRSAARYELYFGELAKANGGVLPPIYGMGASSPKMVHALADHFDGLAKMTFGTIAGDRTAVEVAAYYKWEKGSMGTQIREPGEAALNVVGKRLLPAGIEHGAGLLAKYFIDLHPVASVAMSDPTQATDAGTGQSGGPVSSSSSQGQDALDSLADSKIDVQPVTPPDGIQTGRVVVYGHPIKPPYRFEIKDDFIYVNAVQVSPSLLSLRRAQKVRRSTEEDRLLIRRISKLMDRASTEFRRARKDGKTVIQAQAVVAKVLRSDSDVDELIWNSPIDVSFSVRRKGRHPMWNGITLLEQEPAQESTRDRAARKVRNEKSRLDQVAKWTADLKNGDWLILNDYGGTSVIAGAPASVIKIMESRDMTDSDKVIQIQRLLTQPLPDLAGEIVANYVHEEWEQSLK